MDVSFYLDLSQKDHEADLVVGLIPIDQDTFDTLAKLPHAVINEYPEEGPDVPAFETVTLY